MLNLTDLRNFAVANINYNNWDIYTTQRFIPVSRGSKVWTGEIGTLLLLRQNNNPNRQNGIMGIWYINGVERNEHGNLLTNIRALIHITPILQFREPFRENFTKVRYQGIISINVPRLAVFPYLSTKIFPLNRSGRSYEILLNYLKGILRDKREECNFNDFQCPNIITDEIVEYFIGQLVIYIERVLIIRI